MTAAKVNLKLRYSLLKYFYYLFISTKGTAMVWKPIFHNYPETDRIYEDEYVDTQFMIGDSLMVTPILEKGTKKRIALLPKRLFF